MLIEGQEDVGRVPSLPDPAGTSGRRREHSDGTLTALVRYHGDAPHPDWRRSRDPSHTPARPCTSSCAIFWAGAKGLWQGCTTHHGHRWQHIHHSAVSICTRT